MRYIQELLSCDFLLVCFACVWDVFTRFIVTTFLIDVSLHKASLTVRFQSPEGRQWPPSHSQSFLGG